MTDEPVFFYDIDAYICGKVKDLNARLIVISLISRI